MTDAPNAHKLNCWWIKSLPYIYKYIRLTALLSGQRDRSEKHLRIFETKISELKAGLFT